MSANKEAIIILKETRILYGQSGLSLSVGNASILSASAEHPAANRPGIDIVREAMAAPIGAPRLHELAKGKRTCTIIISDHTRPVPSRDILLPILEELRAGSPGIKVTLLVATGFHRETTAEEIVAKLGTEIASREKIVVHDCHASQDNIQIGTLPSGAPLRVNKIAVETDLLLAEGCIEPHLFAGFSGGRKSVLPGVCDYETVLGNHCSAFIDHPCARTGVLTGNPLHTDMLYAARLVGLAYIVNVVLDEHKRTVAAFAGEFEQAHNQGCELLRHYCQVQAVPADIVISSNGGLPLDQNIYQSIKGVVTAEAAAKPGAVLVMCAECADGHGSEDLYHTLRDCESVHKLYEQIVATPREKTAPDQWVTQIFARVLIKHRVIFVTRPDLRQTIEDMHMTYAPDLETALALARQDKGVDATLTVIPNGISVIVAP